MKNKKIIWVIAGVLIALFAVYILLDTFVIVKPGVTVAQPNDTTQTAGGDGAETPEGAPENTVGSPDAVITDTSYEDENISITISEYKEYGTNIHVADVKISSPEYLKTAFAKGTYGQNITANTSDTAQDVNAIFAINGDYYGAREKGYVVRNGAVYRDSSVKKEDLVIYKDGSFAMIKEGQMTADQLVADGAEQVLSFGPSLVINGEMSGSISSHTGTKNPRTAICLIDELHYLFVVTDGRTDDSDGLAYFELAEFLISLGVKDAYNLDGGGSSSMYFNGNVVNVTYHGNEREVSDIVYIGY